MTLGNLFPVCAFDLRRFAPSRTRALLAGMATLLGMFLAAHSAAAAEPLTEQSAVRLALARPALRDALQGAAEAAQADAAQIGLWPNPSFDVEHDRTPTAGGNASEQKYRLSQSFDLGGKRSLRRDAAVLRAEGSGHDGAVRQLAVVTEVRQAFHDALHRDQRVAVLRDWLDTLGKTEATLATLQRGGEVSGYDRRRIAREALAAQARLAEAQAERERTAEHLSALIGIQAEGKTVGDLLPDEPPALEDLLPRLSARSDLQALSTRVRAFDQERKADERGWVPDVTLGAGVKRVDEPGRSDTGVLLSLSMPIPLFERGQVASRRSAAQARATQAEYQLALTRATGDVRGTWRQARALRKAAIAFGDASLPASQELVRIAEAAYRGGETGVLELLDAYRSRLEAETDALDLQLKARRARIELDALVGAQPQ